MFCFSVRCRAALSHTEVVNKLSETWLGPPALLILFKKLYGCKSAPHMPKSNNFVVTAANLELYFLMQVGLLFFSVFVKFSSFLKLGVLCRLLWRNSCYTVCIYRFSYSLFIYFSCFFCVSLLMILLFLMTN